MYPLFLSFATTLLIDARLTFSLFAIWLRAGVTSMVALSILLSRSHNTCSSRSNGRDGGLPLGLPVDLWLFMARILPYPPVTGSRQERSGGVVIRKEGGLFKGDADALVAALAAGELEFHEGTIGGAWPRIIG